jgi:hypothetical protein
MKQTLIAIIIGFSVLGIAYWFLNQSPSSAVVVDDFVAEPTATDYIGLSEEEAGALAFQNGVPFRVVVIDGESQMVTEDFLPGRINATVEAGIVTSYEVEGFGIEESEANVNSTLYSAVIGMTVAEAEEYAVDNDILFRIGFQDGEPLGVTMDYRPGRITVEVENDIVTGYSVE